jgi:hypothetical protein
MATPVSKEADEARGYFAREKRRKLQDLSAYKTAGFVPPAGTPFDFGSMVTGTSPNILTLPANIEIALISTGSIIGPQNIGMFEPATGVVIFNAGAANPGDLIHLRHLFLIERQIRVFRLAGALPGTAQLFFSGPKSQLSQFGVVTFT